MKRIAMSFALVIFASASIPALAQGMQFTFQTIVYPGDTFTELLGINRASTIVGYHGATVSSGFVLTLPGTFNTQNVPGSTQTRVFGINNSNQTSGFYIDSADNNHGFFQSGGTFTTVGYPGAPLNQLRGLNNTNQATGFYDWVPIGTHRAYSYNELGNVFGLIWLPNSITSPGGGSCNCTVVADGINDHRQVSGYYFDSLGASHGFLLSPGLFVTLDFPGASMTQALGLNNNGVVVGVYQDTRGNRHGFVYNATSPEVYASIDHPNGVGTTTITAINDLGKMVGYFVDSKGHTDGFVGTPIS
jgi:hypothetical protein